MAEPSHPGCHGCAYPTFPRVLAPLRVRAKHWFVVAAAAAGAALVLFMADGRRSRSVAELQTGGMPAMLALGPDMSTPTERAHPLMKHLIIDKVYFPKDREDAGVASVHGFVNGNYVEGNLNIQRTAKYNAEDGSWSGIPNPPPRIAAYKSTVEGVVAQSIRAAMKSLLSPKKPVLRLNSIGADPETALTNEIAKATNQAVDEELAVESADSAALKAKRVQSLLKSIKKRGQRLHARPPPRPVKTLQGCTCRQTYVFEGKVHHGCIRRGGERAWCYTVGGCGVSEGKGKAELTWDHCEPELVRTVKGCQCDFPFTFQGVKMHTCVDSTRTFLWGAEAQRGSGKPRGVWCKTKGDCGQGDFSLTVGKAKWDHCDMPPTTADETAVLAQKRQTSGPAASDGGQGGGGACGLTMGDIERHANPLHFSSECDGGVCIFACRDPHYCPNCAGGNCRCGRRIASGDKCGLQSNRPPAYSGYQCSSGQCVFECDAMSDACADCNNGKCKCL